MGHMTDVSTSHRLLAADIYPFVTDTIEWHCSSVGMNYICKLDIMDVWWCLFGLCNMKGLCQCVPSLLAKHQMFLKIKHDFVGHSLVEMHGEVTKRRKKRKRPGTHGCMYLKLLQTPNMRRCIILNYLCGFQYVSVWSIHPHSVWGCFCWGLKSKRPILCSQVTS